MPSKKNPIICSFRTTEVVSQLMELIAKKRGQSKSEYIGINVIDNAMRFERTRQIDTLTDFLDCALPFMTQGMDEKTAGELIDKATILQRNYIEQRLEPHMRLQRHLTDIAIRSYLQDYADEIEGVDGFIINQSLQSIYDQLLKYELISHEEWEEKVSAYNVYMQETGLKLLQQE